MHRRYSPVTKLRGVASHLPLFPLKFNESTSERESLMALKRDLETTSVSRLNLRDPVTISENATVRDAVQVMRNAKLGCVVVVNENSEATGIYTEAMLRNSLNESAEVLNNTVAAEMTSRLPWVSPTDEVRMVLDAMETNNMRFIAVLDEARQVIGITGQKSLIEFVAESFPYEVLTQDLSSHEPSLKKEGA